MVVTRSVLLLSLVTIVGSTLLEATGQLPVPGINKAVIYRTVVEKQVPFATHGAIIIDGAGLPEKNVLKVVMSALNACAQNTVVIIPGAIIKKFFAHNNTITNPEQWLCATTKSTVVFVPKSAVEMYRPSKFDKILGVRWSTLAPIKDIADPDAYPDGNDLINDLKNIFVDKKDYTDQTISPAWGLYVLGGSPEMIDLVCKLFEEKLKTTVSFFETADGAALFKKTKMSKTGFPVVASGLVGAFPQEKPLFVPFREFFKSLQSTTPQSSNFPAIIKNFYGPISKFVTNKGLLPQLRLAKATDFQPLMDAQVTVSPNLLRQKPIIDVLPFSTHGAIIVNYTYDQYDVAMGYVLTATFREVPSAILIVPSIFVYNYLLKNKKIPNSSEWLCREINAITVFLPKKMLERYEAQGLKKKYTDMLLGIRWSQMKAITDIQDANRYAHLNSGSIIAHIFPTILMQKIFIPAKEYKNIKRPDWSIYITGHGGKPEKRFAFLKNYLRRLSTEIVELQLQEKLNKLTESKKKTLRELEEIKNRLTASVIKAVGSIANFDPEKFFELANFFNEACPAKLLFLDTCFGYPAKFNDFLEKIVRYIFMTSALVDMAVDALHSKDIHLKAFFDILQMPRSQKEVALAALYPIILEHLVETIYAFFKRIDKDYITPYSPQVRFPGDIDFWPLAFFGRRADAMVVLSHTLVKKFSPKSILDVSKYFKRVHHGEKTESPVYPKLILLYANVIPFAIKLSRGNLKTGPNFIQMLPDAPMTIFTEIDASAFTLQEMVRAFYTRDLHENRAFMVKKMKVRGTVQDPRDDTVISEVELIFINEVISEETQNICLVRTIQEKQKPIGGSFIVTGNLLLEQIKFDLFDKPEHFDIMQTIIAMVNQCGSVKTGAQPPSKAR